MEIEDIKKQIVYIRAKRKWAEQLKSEIAQLDKDIKANDVKIRRMEKELILETIGVVVAIVFFLIGVSVMFFSSDSEKSIPFFVASLITSPFVDVINRTRKLRNE